MFFQKAGPLKRSKSMQAVMTVLPSLEMYFEWIQFNSNLETCDTKILMNFSYKYLPWNPLRVRDSG